MNRKISLRDGRNWIILLALISASFNWLNYSYLKSVDWIVSVNFTLNFFLYFAESSYFMVKALSIVKDKRSILTKLFIALGVFCCSLFVVFLYHQNTNNQLNKSDYCSDSSYVFFALSPCILTVTFGSVFLYIKVQVKNN